MRIAITGASGFLGRALISTLVSAQHEVVRLVRRPAGTNEITWDPADGTIDSAALEGTDAMVHLAGENIAERWTQDHKRRVLESRRQGTGLISGAAARLARRPQVLVSASAVGYYGDRGDEPVNEWSPAGSGFAAEVATVWESSTAPARDAGIRVVNLRIGVVLAAGGGALAKMLLPFRMGLGGVLGSGRQWMSWIALEDLVAVVACALVTPELQGPVNAVAPHPVTNAEFTRTLGRVLRRPTALPVPAFSLRLLYGSMADELLLAGAKVSPDKLLKIGYRFQHPELEGALRSALRS